MAYALGFPKDVTELLYSLRDWRWEIVRKNGGTPSRLCFEIGPRYPWEEDGTPWLQAIYMPYYTVESDIEQPDYGKVVLDRRSGDGLASARIERSDIGNTNHTFILSKPRGYHGRRPPKFRKLQKKNDHRVKEAWFQCEPCEVL
jgi:hypothetical protein